MNEFGIVKPVPPAMVIEHPDHEPGFLTAVVLGLPIGGTSMVAAVVDALGLPFVKSEAFWFAFEADEFNNSTLDKLRESIGSWNAQFDAWGYKDPHTTRFDPAEFHAALRNPHYLIASKDLASMTIRWIHNPDRPNDGKLPIDRFAKQVKDEMTFLTWLERLPAASKLLVSYWAALRDREQACRAIADFLHLRPTAEQFKRAVARMSLTGGYLTKEDLSCA